MELPKYFPPNQLSLPYKFIFVISKLTKNNINIFLLPLFFNVIGVLLFYYYHLRISRGMLFAMGWSSLTLIMLYYAQFKFHNIFLKLSGVISDSPEDSEKTEQIKSKIYSIINNNWLYLPACLVVLIVFPIFYQLKMATHVFPLLIWNVAFFIYTAFIGGYGMGISFMSYKVIKTIIEETPFKLNPYHPDMFMGLKPLGSLAVVYGLVTSSSSLLFPLIFEAINQMEDGKISWFLGCVLFLVIFGAIITTFSIPFLKIKEKIEEEKFVSIIEHDKEYRMYLLNYKDKPSSELQGIIDVLEKERNKLNNIKLFPFEARMLLEIFVSILMPILMLLLERYFRA